MFWIHAIMYFIFYIFILFMDGVLMGEERNQETSYKWVTIQDEKTRIQADFPSKPLKMLFELPFQNTPPTDFVSVYSLPSASGLFVLSTYTSAEMKPKKISKEHLLAFFQKVLVPHFFYNPSVFNDHLEFQYEPKVIEGYEGANFNICYFDHHLEKNIEGSSFVSGNSLYVYFYLASAKDFDHEIAKHFVKTVRFF